MLNKCFFVISILLLSFSGATQPKWSLQACLDYAIKNNVSIKEADIQTRLSALVVSQNKASLWPSLSFNGNSGYRFGLSENPTTGILQSSNFFSTGFSLSTGVTLFNWFSKQHSLKAAQLSEEADKMAVKKAENDVLLNVSAAYLQVLLTKEFVTTAILQFQQTKTQEEIVRKKIAMGILSELDAAQVQLQLVTDSTSLLTAEGNKEKAFLQLKAVLNLDAAFAFDIEPIPVEVFTSGELLKLEPEVVFNRAAKNLPQVRQMNYQIEAAEQRTKASKAGKYPTFSLYGSMGSNFVNIPSAQAFTYIPMQATGAKVDVNGTSYEVMAPSYQVSGFGVTPFFRQLHKNFGQNFGLSMSVPILNGKTFSINQKREELNLQQLRLQTAQLQQELKTTIYTAYSEALTAWKKVKLNEQMVEEAKKVFDAAQKRYNLNLLSTQDLLINKNNLEKARADLLLAKYDFLFKTKLLEFYRLI